MGTPAIAVVVNAFNAAGTLERALTSVLGQTFGNLELILVDDGSTDSTWDVMTRVAAGDPRARCYRQANSGCPAARQAGIDRAEAPFITMLDADDRAHPTWLERLDELRAGASADLAFCGAEVIFADGSRKEERPRDLGPFYGNLHGLFLSGCYLVRRSLVERAGGYRAGTEPVDHTDFALRLLRTCGTELRTAASDEQLVSIERPSGTRYGPRARLDGVQHLMEAYPEEHGRDPAVRSAHQAMGGLAAAELGDWPAARRWFRSSFRSDPSARGALRLVLSCVPPAGRRIWGRHRAVPARR